MNWFNKFVSFKINQDKANKNVTIHWWLININKNLFPTDVPAESAIDYYSMPALSELDDFDLCLRKPNAVYCIVDFAILEDDTPLYQFIKVRC